jgi:hypothetical protein
MIKLNDILKLDEEILKITKIRFMVMPSNDRTENPHEYYKKDPAIITEKWFLWKKENQGHPFSINP